MERKINSVRQFPKPVLTAEEEKLLWEKPLFVFDTSAIGSLYFLSPDAKRKVLDIIDQLQDFFWIPARVMKEYNRNRKEFLNQPIKEAYNEPAFLSAHYLDKLDNFIKGLSSDPLFHPCFEKEYIETMKSIYNTIKPQIDKIRIQTREQLKKGKENIKHAIDKDIINTCLQNLSHGVPFSFNELMSTITEGSVRYSHYIPPGYEDADKLSVDKFGDLIIWKEICRHAKKVDTSVIFICNDMKEDWNAGNANEMIPREELIEEFNSYAGNNIWFYTLSGFLSKLKDHYNVHPELNGNIQDLDTILKELEIIDLPDDEIKVICDNCQCVHSINSDDLSWNWEVSYTDERGMGEELCLVCEDGTCCPNCETTEEFTFTMYQYPVNVINYAEVEARGCKILEHPPIVDFIQASIYDCCIRCGEWRTDIDKDGFCQDCMDEFEYEINRD